MNTKVMTGLMELTPEAQLKFEQIKSTIAQEFARFGFSPIDTPVLERSEILLAKAGGETEQQIYQFKKGDTDIALRFDLTVPLARYVAEHYHELVFPFRRSQIGKAYRGERPQKGRFREFYQCDIDVIAQDQLDLSYDAEMIQIINSVFTKLNLAKFTIRLNNRKILTGLLEGLGLEAKSTAILRIIDKIEKISPQEFDQELSKLGLNQDQIQNLNQFISLTGTPTEIIKQLKKLPISTDKFNQGVTELKTVVDLADQFGVSPENYRIDLSIARGLDYYTGTVYETFFDDYPEFGSICSGGRYDDLASHYIDKKLPGVGISIGLTRLFSQLLENNLIDFTKKTVADVLVVPLSTQEITLANQVAQALRQTDINTDVLLADIPIKKKFKHADRLGVKQIVVIGEDEAKRQLFTLQNMTSGEKTQLTLKELVDKLAHN